tara:strand:+ start:519 stop:1769 length:1251 start_codon:yes stop_codon:yes gene_type:complete
MEKLQLHISPAQMSKIKKGLPIQIAHKSMGADKGNVVISLKPEKAKKMMSAFKRGKGLRIQMDEDEVRGSGFFDKVVKSVKSVAKKTEKVAVDAGNAVAKPVKSVLKEIPEPIREVLKSEAQGLIDTTGATLGTMIAKTTGDAELGGMVQKGISDTGDELLSGEKLSLGSKILPIAKKSVNVAVDMIDDPQYKAVAKAIVKKAGAGLYGKAGSGLRGSGLSGKGLKGSGLSGGAIENKMMKREKPVYTTMPVKRPLKGSQEMKDKMAKIRAGKKGEGFGSFVKNVGKTAKKGAQSTKKAVFGKRMADEMEYVLPVMGGTMGAVGGSAIGGVGGGAFGSAVGASAGSALAKDMKKKGYGVKKNKMTVKTPTRGRNPKVKPPSDIPTFSPFAKLSSGQNNPFVPMNSFQAGGTGENIR